MSWELLSVVLARDAIPGVSERLLALGAAGLEESPLPAGGLWVEGAGPGPDALLLRAWFESPDHDAIASALIELELSWDVVTDRDWEQDWRAQHRPVRISARLVVAPPWDAPPGALIVEPGQGFGTGGHATTRLALRAIDALPETGTLLDVGCGSGILALAAARLGFSARGIDVDPAAVADARANAAANDLRVAFDTTPIASLPQGADVVVANMRAGVLLELRDDLIRLTGRCLILSGARCEQEQEVWGAFDPRLARADVTREGGWACGVYLVRVGAP